MSTREPSDVTRSWLRTVVPAVQAALVADSGAIAVPDWATAAFGGAAETVSVAIVLALIYPRCAH